MPLKAMKRSASKAGFKQSGVAKQCRALLSTVRSADNVPQPVRAMVCDSLTRTFGTYKEARHPLQSSVAALVGKVVHDAESKLQGAISDAQHKKAAVESEASALIAANDTAAGHSEAASTALANSKAAVVDCKRAFKDAKAALHDLEAAAKEAEVAASATTAKKTELDALATGIANLAEQGRVEGVAKVMGSRLEPEFLTHVRHTYSTQFQAWGTFDGLVNKRLGEILQKALGELANELSVHASAKEASNTSIEAAKAAVAAADENSKAAEAAIEGANAAAKEADTAAKAAAAALKPHQHHINKAAAAVAHAEEALTSFTKGPLAAYTEVEARTAPPPEPEAAHEPASIEAAMAPAPAPAARAAPSVLPSPGVLSWVAQKSGLARSPEIAQTPQIASSPRR